jgi:hypothetical protein
MSPLWTARDEKRTVKIGRKVGNGKGLLSCAGEFHSRPDLIPEHNGRPEDEPNLGQVSPPTQRRFPVPIGRHFPEPDILGRVAQIQALYECRVIGTERVDPRDIGKPLTDYKGGGLLYSVFASSKPAATRS